MLIVPNGLFLIPKNTIHRILLSRLNTIYKYLILLASQNFVTQIHLYIAKYYFLHNHILNKQYLDLNVNYK